jgi:hypothetical protein
MTNLFRFWANRRNTYPNNNIYPLDSFKFKSCMYICRAMIFLQTIKSNTYDL